jgi:alpha-1,2-mannosyltransferase
VSWSHHWVWVAPALVVGWLAVYRRWPVDRGGWPAVALLAITAVFAIGQRVMPHADERELGWSWWQHLLGNSYLITGMTFLVWTVSRTVPEPAVPAPAEARRGQTEDLAPQPV